MPLFAVVVKLSQAEAFYFAKTVFPVFGTLFAYIIIVFKEL